MTDPSDRPDHPPEHLDLFALVRGELPTADVLSAGDHLRTCVTCRDDLVDTVVGNAVLARAARTQSPVTRATPAPEPVRVPPLAVGTRRRSRTRLLLAGAAAVAVVGAVGGVVASQVADDDVPTPDEQVAALDAVAGGPAGEVRTTVDGARTDVTIVADRLPEVGTGAFYQAWLLDPVSNKMLPLGPLAGGTSHFRVDSDLMASYSMVDISLENDDGDPAHSATSVLRGSY